MLLVRATDAQLGFAGVDWLSHARHGGTFCPAQDAVRTAAKRTVYTATQSSQSSSSVISCSRERRRILTVYVSVFSGSPHG